MCNSPHMLITFIQIRNKSNIATAACHPFRSAFHSHLLFKNVWIYAKDVERNLLCSGCTNSALKCQTYIWKLQDIWRQRVIPSLLSTIQYQSMMYVSANMSLMKQQSVVSPPIHNFTGDRKTLDRSLIDQYLSMSCFYENIRGSNIFVDTRLQNVCL